MFTFGGGWDVEVVSRQPNPTTRRVGYCIVMLVVILFPSILCLGHHIMSLFNQLSESVINYGEGISPEVPKVRSMFKSCFSSIHKYKFHLISAHMDYSIDF